MATANIHIGAAQPLWRGVLDAAEAGDGYQGTRDLITCLVDVPACFRSLR